MPDDSATSHRIRLAGPWNVKTELAEQPLRVKLPATWRDILGNFTGIACFSRAFHAPTGIQNEKLFLVIPPINGTGKLSLNGQLLGEINASDSENPVEKKIEITSLIQPFNQIEIELTCTPEQHPNCGLSSPIYLEIVE